MLSSILVFYSQHLLIHFHKHSPWHHCPWWAEHLIVTYILSLHSNLYSNSLHRVNPFPQYQSLGWCSDKYSKLSPILIQEDKSYPLVPASNWTFHYSKSHSYIKPRVPQPERNFCCQSIYMLITNDKGLWDIFIIPTTTTKAQRALHKRRQKNYKSWRVGRRAVKCCSLDMTWLMHW